MGKEDAFRAIGKRIPKLEGPELVTGRAIFADDVQLRGMLFERVLRSPHAHARIRGIDIGRAKAMPGVVDVVTGEDLPDAALLAKDEVYYEGHKVALVAATSRRAAEDALEEIQVEYEVLPAVVDPVVAMAADAPRSRYDASERL